ncbi:MAG: TIM barrel protein [candidate division KSB1 bacterium]|nr:TIM barrel protein [candidate division KSB1 bacterium]
MGASERNTSTRRGFIKQSLAWTAGAAAASGFYSRASAGEGQAFKLKYAPGLNMFKEHAGPNPIDNIKFIHDHGFRAVFDNGLMNKPPALQEKITAALQNRGMDLGPFVLYADFEVKSFVTRDTEIRDMLMKKMRRGVETAKRVGAKWALVVPGRFDEGLEWDYQTANVIDNLKFCCDILEPAGLVMVIEPLNAWTNHPGLFLTKIPQAYMICKAVNSPSCKIVNDIYHQQITEGNLIPNIDMAWEEIAAFHLGDNPGRKEPTTGEINYKNIFKHLYEKGCQAVLCMEHGKSLQGKKGEQAVIQAYRECDHFSIGG